MNPTLAARKAAGIPVAENLAGLAWMVKIFDDNGNAAFLSMSKGDMDDDGVEDPNVDYSTDPDHQSQTSFDPNGTWLCANNISYFVLPGGFATGSNARHGGVALGCLGTMIYGATGAISHGIFADVGPSSKFGEFSLEACRELGFERVVNGQILNDGLDGEVTLLIYIGSNIGPGPVTQAQINAAAAPLWQAFGSP